MNWILIAMFAPFLWATSTFIDKFLVSKYFRSGVGTLVLYSSFIGLPVAICIVLLKPSVLSISVTTAFFIIVNSFLFILYLFPYLKALSKADTSIVVPIFQTIPVFSYVLAFFVLGETLSRMQIIGSLCIISGAIGISLNFRKKGVRLTKDVLLLQLIASFIVALNGLFFKFFAIQLDFWTVSFWQYTGFFIFGLLLFIFIKKYREDFLPSFKINGKNIIRLNMLNEVVNICALLIFTFSSLLAPLALVGVINGVQPLFVFLFGIILSLFVPHIIRENIERKV